MNIIYKGGINERVRNCFNEVMKRFQGLHEYEVVLIQDKIKSSTMQAQPIISLKSIFTGVKRYRIKLNEHIRDHKDLKITDVPDDVLKGWFAHELGHVVDYKRRSNIQMVFFGLKYLLSEKFKRKVEHNADYIAITYGYQEEILETKRYIVEHNIIGAKYKNKILKYYLTEEDVMLCSQDESILEPYLDL
jgi:hypothetical protein